MCLTFCQTEIESRLELERRLKEAEEALQELEKGLSSRERSTEAEEQMKGNVTHLRSESPPAHATDNILSFGSVESKGVKTAAFYDLTE